MGPASLGLEIGVFCACLYGVLLLSAILGLNPGRRHVRALLGAALVVHSHARGRPVARRARSQSQIRTK